MRDTATNTVRPLKCTTDPADVTYYSISNDPPRINSRPARIIKNLAEASISEQTVFSLNLDTLAFESSSRVNSSILFYAGHCTLTTKDFDNSSGSRRKPTAVDISRGSLQSSQELEPEPPLRRTPAPNQSSQDLQPEPPVRTVPVPVAPPMPIRLLEWNFEVPDSGKGKYAFNLPDGYRYCTHQVTRTSASPNRRTYWVSPTQGGIEIHYDVPSTAGYIGPFTDGTGNWLNARVKVYGIHIKYQTAADAYRSRVSYSDMPRNITCNVLVGDERPEGSGGGEANTRIQSAQQAQNYGELVRYRLCNNNSIGPIKLDVIDTRNNKTVFSGTLEQDSCLSLATYGGSAGYAEILYRVNNGAYSRKSFIRAGTDETIY